MNISIFGLGYVGCVSLGCLAKNGHKVIGVDVEQSKIDLINAGRPTIIESEIDHIIKEVYDQERISATQDYRGAVKNSDLSFIAVGTPSTDEGHLDLSYIFRVAEQIGEALAEKSSFHTVVIRSTVMPGTNKKVGEVIEQKSGKLKNKDFAVVSNPEFLREGSAVADYYNPPVTVIGSDNQKAINQVSSLYDHLPAPVKVVSIEVAELIKYVNNAWHALKITFGNEVGNICKKLGIDSHEVMDLFVMDKQLNLSAYYLKPGFAYGGSCLPKDLKGLKTLAHDFYLSSPILESIENSNDVQKKTAIRLIEKHDTRNVAILGFSFKEGTDDLRYSPIVEVAEYMLGKGYHLRIYDKNVSVSKLTGTNRDYINKHIPHLSDMISDDIAQVIIHAELVVITHRIDGVDKLIANHPEKYFIDLARVIEKKYPNYEGICW
jgi:GDP-mannose 6-dehydrogenase